MTAGAGPESWRAPLADASIHPAGFVPGLLGDSLDSRLERGGAARRRATGLRGHELRHVALDLHLARHERLHPGRRITRHKDLLGGPVVGGHLPVSAVSVPDPPVAPSLLRAHVQMTLGPE